MSLKPLHPLILSLNISEAKKKKAKSNELELWTVARRFIVEVICVVKTNASSPLFDSRVNVLL